MENSDATTARIVRCPKCQSLLREPGPIVYQCGGCGTTLRGKTYSGSEFQYDTKERSKVQDELPDDDSGATASQPWFATGGEAKRRLPPRKHCCRPVLEGAPFIICSSCFNLLQMPSDFTASSNTVRKLRCGSCWAVLSLSYTYRKPYQSPNSDSSEDHDAERTATSLGVSVQFPQGSKDSTSQLQNETAERCKIQTEWPNATKMHNSGEATVQTQSSDYQGPAPKSLQATAVDDVTSDLSLLFYSKPIRRVKCPTCHNVLEEPGAVATYKCGGCGTKLRAKIRTNESEVAGASSSPLWSGPPAESGASSSPSWSGLPADSRHLDSSDVADSKPVRHVKCPTCYDILEEPDTVATYKCGGCGTKLRAKIRTSESELAGTSYSPSLSGLPAESGASSSPLWSGLQAGSMHLDSSDVAGENQLKQIQLEGSHNVLGWNLSPQPKDVIHTSSDLATSSMFEVETHSTPYKDAMAWLMLWFAMGNQRLKVLNHTCTQQADHKLVGRDDIIEQIMGNILLHRNGASNCTVICINGRCGLGKTSLLRVLYYDQELMDAFDQRIWIQISDKLDILMLFRKIIEFSTNDHCNIMNIDLLQELVVEEIKNKKFLLFLDDAETEDQRFWNSIFSVLNAGAKGSAVVMATRSGFIASLRDVTHVYYLNPLSEENHLMILQQHSGVGTDIQSNTDLVIIAKWFISRFGSSPLNSKAIGGLLCHADTVSLDKENFEVSAMPLQLCHYFLPIHLKKCLAFCSLFPKGYVFDKHHMVLQWISHGCVRPSEGCELEDVGAKYFNELVCRAFFQYSPIHNDKDDKFVMHELIYEVVESVSGDKYFKSEDPMNSIPENILHLSLVSSEFETTKLMHKTEELKDLQTFLAVQPECKPNMSFPTLNLVGLDDFFLKFTSLETLDLSHTDIEKLPGSIAGLRNLRYLSVNNTSIRALPSEPCSLSNLQTLEARHCRFLTELPGDTKKLVKLRHLDVTKDLGLGHVHLPHGIGQLTELRTLPVFHASGDSSHCSISELGSLHNLRGCLQLSGLESVNTGSEAQKAKLKDKHRLQDLTLQWHDGGVDIDVDDEEEADSVAEQVLESLQPHTNLQELAIRGYAGSAFPSWMQGPSSLPSLVSLTLDGCCNCTQLPAMIAHLPSLKFLSVRKTYDVQRLMSSNIVHGATKFPALELLNLWEMYGLEELFEVSKGDCPRLRKVCVSRCPDLKTLPCTPSLTELVLHCCHRLPDIPELVSLASLKIEGFHGLRSFSLPAAAALPALRKLEIRSCKELASVDGLSALTTVQRLKIAGCPKLVLPSTSGLPT